jgi:hypothetical protein
MWVLSAAAPFIGFAVMSFYIEVLHWEHFPKWLLRDETPKQASPESRVSFHEPTELIAAGIQCAHSDKRNASRTNAAESSLANLPNAC